jgi:hypothetical protein
LGASNPALSWTLSLPIVWTVACTCRFGIGDATIVLSKKIDQDDAPDAAANHEFRHLRYELTPPKPQTQDNDSRLLQPRRSCDDRTGCRYCSQLGIPVVRTLPEGVAVACLAAVAVAVAVACLAAVAASSILVDGRTSKHQERRNRRARRAPTPLVNPPSCLAG